MMAAYFIWNPFIDSNAADKLCLVLARGDMDSIADGTKDFVRELLKDLRIDAGVEKWEVEPCRSAYFSEYLDSDDWHDRWQLVWRMRVTLDNELKRPARHDEPWTGTNAVDESWSAKKAISEDDDARCLVVAEFTSKTDARNARKAIEEDDDATAFQEQHKVDTPALTVGTALTGSELLHADLGRFNAEFYSAGADYAEHVMQLCRNAGGKTHFEDE